MRSQFSYKKFIIRYTMNANYDYEKNKNISNFNITRKGIAFIEKKINYGRMKIL